jgi:hypothetical protein
VLRYRKFIHCLCHENSIPTTICLFLFSSPIDLIEALDEFYESYESALSEGGEQGQAIEAPRIPAKVIRGGVGPINKRDMEIAKLAGARLLLFNVGYTKDAAKQCKKEGLKVFQFDLMEEVVDIVCARKQI